MILCYKASSKFGLQCKISKKRRHSSLGKRLFQKPNLARKTVIPLEIVWL
jgi:hypothetical protein